MNARMLVPVTIGILLIWLVDYALGNAAEKRARTECESRKIQKGSDEREQQCSEFYENNVNFFLSLFLIIAWGALVRTVLRLLDLSVPYTVVLMLSGLVLGAFTRIQVICPFWSSYTKIARMPPKIILYIFLPALVYESAFNMKVHVFLRSAYQILVVALPGMLISTAATGLMCKAMMQIYNWSFTVAMLYGSIISATDPVAVVSILRELGTSESLGMIIEGESLLNDGVAILLYEIFEELALGKIPSHHIAQEVTIKILKISLGGPTLGFCMGKAAVFWLSLIFNDAATEITITIVATYLTYWLGEHFGVSGVVACVVLGLKMSSDSTSISPEVEKLVHHFWEMIGYLANTVLFVIVGVIVTETALSKIQAFDWVFLLFLYILLNIIRLTMLMMLMPWLTRIGYGLQWKDMIVMMWGGLRGAVGLCLSLEVYYSKPFCELADDKIGPKFLFHTAGIVFFTLAINGTTTKWLLDKLGMTEVSPGRLQDMTNAVKQIVGAQLRTLAMLKHDRFLADSSWELVEHYTMIHDPYRMQKIKALKMKDTATVLTLKMEEEEFGREDEDDFDPEGRPADNQPTPMEFKIMTEEARQRMLKALKVSFWRQYEQGVLADKAVQILVGVAESTADKELHMIHARDFQKYWVVHGFYHWIRTKVIQKLGLDKPAVLPPRPIWKWRRSIWWLTTRDWFDGIIHAIVIINLIPVIWELVLLVKENSNKKEKKESALNEFFWIGCAFTGVYTLEFILKLIGHGCKFYWTTKWNYIDVTVLLISYADIALGIYFHNLDDTKSGVGGSSKAKKSITAVRYAVTVLRLARLSRSLRLFRPLMPKLNGFIDNKVNYTLFRGYDIGKGLVTAIEDVLKFLPQMVEHPRVLAKLKSAMDNERLETIRALGLLQKAHPMIAIGVKTRHASRAVLNQMRDTLSELKDDGLVDETESSVLTMILERKMKRLWSTPASIVPSSPEILLSNVVWVLSNSELTSYIYNHATLLTFSEGDIVTECGDPPNGVYVIVSGMVKIHYVPTIEAVESQANQGQIPNLELYTDLTFQSEEMDFLSTGTVLGELGILTGLPCASVITCETSVVAYHVSQNSIKEALSLFTDKNDSLESRLWRSVGMKIGASLLPTQAAYQAWTLDKIRMHLERSAAPVGSMFETMTIPDFVEDVLLINGQVLDGSTKHLYTAPCLLPHSCTKISKVEGTNVPARVLIVAGEDIEHEMESESQTSIHQRQRTSSVPVLTNTESNVRQVRGKAPPVSFGVRKAGH